ncbi:MAG: hypothetical protein IH985_05195 [Planctomycetes bacterium]|nr:hypothetical protein [Planctomycetota bacterium]
MKRKRRGTDEVMRKLCAAKLAVPRRPYRAIPERIRQVGAVSQWAVPM